MAGLATTVASVSMAMVVGTPLVDGLLLFDIVVDEALCLLAGEAMIFVLSSR